jgi:hypothetical protein
MVDLHQYTVARIRLRLQEFIVDDCDAVIVVGIAPPQVRVESHGREALL